MASTQAPLQPGPAAVPVRTNWAGNYTFQAQRLAQPQTRAELQALIAEGNGPLKTVGTRHSFNHIADTAGTQIDVARLKDLSLRPEERTVTIGARITYGELAPWLDMQGFAVHNLASLPHISVAGACATATHGSGHSNGCLTTAVAAMEILSATGQPLTLSREATPDAFRLAAVHLGALGVVTELTLAVVPTFRVAQMVYEHLSFDQLEHHLPEIFSAGYSVSLFTDWQEHRATQAWIKRKLTAPADEAFPDTFFGARRQTQDLHPLPGLSAENCTEQMGRPGAWYERLPHFRLDYTPSAGAELQSEYFVPLSRAYEALHAIEHLRDRITPHLIVSEMRSIAADDLPLSMAFGRPSLAFHFTWKQDLAPVLALLPALEAALKPFAARPHWGKLFTTPPDEMQRLFPALRSLHELARTHDPDERFRNAYLDELFRGM